MHESFAQRVLPSIRGDDPDPAAEAQACLGLMAEQLVDAIKTELKSDSYVLLDWADHQNIGDRAIHVGELLTLGEYCRAKCVYTAHVGNFNAAKLRQIPADIPILFNGGGNLGDLWPLHQKFRERVIEKFPDRRFIILPQSMLYTEPAALERASRLFRQANIMIFLRDRQSIELAAEHFGTDRVRLAPDMAIVLSLLMPRLLRARRGKPEVDLLYLFRRDKERSEARPESVKGAQLSDWASLEPDWNEKDVRVPGASRLAATLGLTEVLKVPGGRKSWLYFIIGLRQILKARRVVTDRLHAHVLSMLGGVPNTLYANDYHKNRAFYETWMEGLSLCRFEE